MIILTLTLIRYVLDQICARIYPPTARLGTTVVTTISRRGGLSLT